MVIVFAVDYAGNRHGWVHTAGISAIKFEVLCPTTVQVECTWFHVHTYSKRTVKEWWISQCLKNCQHCLISTHKDYNVFVTLNLYLRLPGATWVSLSQYTVKRSQNNLLWLLEILVSPWSYIFCNILWPKSCKILYLRTFTLSWSLLRWHRVNISSFMTYPTVWDEILNCSWSYLCTLLSLAVLHEYLHYWVKIKTWRL